MSSDLSDLDADGLLAAAGEAERAARLAEVHKLEVLSAWAGVHSSDPSEGPDGHIARRVGNVLRQVGGEGTPGVQDFCLGEIALARGAGVTATQHMLADVLDLQHRLPLTWAVCRRGECEVWVARRVAKLSRHLGRDKVGLVDSAISRMIATEAPGRVLQVAEAKIIEADTDLHEQRCEAERRRRYVGLGRTDEHGLRTLIARLEAGDATAVDAIVHVSGRSSPRATPRPTPTSCAPSPSPGSPAPPSSSLSSSNTATHPTPNRSARRSRPSTPMSPSRRRSRCRPRGRWRSPPTSSTPCATST